MEVRDWTYGEFPDLDRAVEGAVEVATTGDEAGADYVPDVAYARRGGAELHLEVLRPRSRNGFPGALPCMAYVQGSAWGPQNMRRDVPQLARLAARGMVVAMVEYRPSSAAPFPAQVADAQEAVRWIASHAGELGADAGRIVLAGNSSGGHTALMAALVDTSSGEPVPAPMGTGSVPRVRGIIDLYGAVSLMHPDGFPTTLDHHRPESPEGRLMGGIDLRSDRAACERASVTTYLGPGTSLPPVLIAHGTKDRTVSCELSIELYERLRALGLDAELVLLRGADHGGPEFFSEAMVDAYERFVGRCCA